MMPSSSDLTYFIEVAQTLNLSRAAERIGISQPSLTLAIQRLEDSVGAPLLFRSKKGVSLTQGGRQLLVHAREMLQQWEKIRSRTLATSEEIQGAYTLGAHPSVALYTFPHFFAELMQDYPHLEIKLRHDLSRKIVEQVIQMEVDMGVVVNPVPHPDLVIKKLCTDEVTFWKGKGKHTTQDMNSDTCVLICNPDLLQAQSLMKRMKSGRFAQWRILETESLELIAELTAKGAGVGILPSRVATREKTLTPVSGTPVFNDDICLVYRMEQKGVKALQFIAEKIQKVLN